jgi:hypothetical protein
MEAKHMPKEAGLSARDFYPNFEVFSTPDNAVPEGGDQQALNVSNSEVTQPLKAMNIWVWLIIIIAAAVVLHLKI